MSGEIDWETCEHIEYKVCNQEPDWIDAYCDACGARLIFRRDGIEAPDN